MKLTVNLPQLIDRNVRGTAVPKVCVLTVFSAWLPWLIVAS